MLLMDVALCGHTWIKMYPLGWPLVTILQQRVGS